MVILSKLLDPNEREVKRHLAVANAITALEPELKELDDPGLRARSDELRAKALKAQVSELERALRATEQEASAAVGGARQKIKHERATSERTQPLSAARAEATTGEDGSSQRRSRDRRAAHPRA